MRPDGSIVPESELRRLWVVTFNNADDTFPLSFIGVVGYLARNGMWTNMVHEAAAWKEEDRAMAEDVAASIVLLEPEKYFGKVSVVRIIG